MLRDSDRYRAVVSEVAMDCADCNLTIRPLQEALEHKSSHQVIHIACQPHFSRSQGESYPLIQKWVHRDG